MLDVYALCQTILWGISCTVCNCCLIRVLTMPHPPLQGFFRDVTREDVAALLPTLADPLEDPIYLIPPIGRHYSAHDASEAGVHTPSSLQRSSRPPAHATLLKDRVSELKAQAAAEVGHAALTSCTHDCCPQVALSQMLRLAQPHAPTTSRIYPMSSVAAAAPEVRVGNSVHSMMQHPAGCSCQGC